MRVYKSETFVDEGKSIGVFHQIENTVNEPVHRHDFIEIIYILSGESKHVIDNVAYDVKRGDVLFINYGSTHSFSCNNYLEYVNIIFSPETVGESLITPENAFALLSLTAFNEMRGASDGGKITFSGNERSEIESVINAMIKEKNDDKAYTDAIMQSYMNILVVKMLRKVDISAYIEKKNKLWQELSDYIDKNLNSKLTLEALAKKCFYNPSYFSRAFKEKFGVSFKEYVGRKRIEYSCRLLEDTDYTVDEISGITGFSDRSSFYQLFAKYTDATPSEYRKNKGGKK
jgi:AraC-like DNA-binding protein